MTTAYTPLETLLLFQALRSEGLAIGAHSFDHISDHLKSVRLVRDDPAFDDGRLSPDALRERYLGLVKEEARKDLDQELDQHGATNGDASPGSRKRKAPSPTLPSVQEASKHAHLIPQLVARLYTRYRETVVREIREYERRYDTLKRDIDDIEAGKWDDKLQTQRSVSATQSPRPPSSAQLPGQGNRADQARPSQSDTASPSTAHAGLNPPPKRNSAKIGDVINHGPEPQNGPDRHRRTSSGTTLPPLHEMAPQSPRFGIPPKMPAGPGASQTQSHGYSHSPPSAHQSPYAHHAHPMAPAAASPQLQNASSRPSSSPRPILPPPSGLKFPTPTPTQHLGSPNMRAPSVPPQQQYSQPPHPHRLSTGPATPGGYRHPQMYQQQPAYYQQQPPYADRRTSYPPPPPQPHMPPGYMHQPPHAGGYQLPPFSVDPQEPVRGRTGQPLVQQQQQQPPVHQAQRPPYVQQRTPSVPATVPRAVQQPSHASVQGVLAMLGTPSRNRCFRSPRRSSLMNDSTPKPSPAVEGMPVSPVRKPAQLAGQKRGNAQKKDATSPVESTATPMPKDSRRSGRNRRDRSPHSVVSSTADESARTRRSQSVSTTAGATQRSEARAAAKDDVKPEPMTPAEGADTDPNRDLASTAGGRMTRKRRGTLSTQPQQPQAKRKRQHSPDERSDDEAENAGTPPHKSNTILATRNFHKIAAPVMQDINSHKHASYFANPVRDKDAPGYSEIIKQSQSLKSIRTAITAGAKAVNAAASALDSPTATTTTPAAGNSKASAAAAPADSSIVELEATPDIVPPKGIVNGAQLEKELVRTFANAVMFNPGEDGMVSDTREIFADVDAKLREWRGAEKGEGEEVEGGAGRGGSVEEEGKGKRRKG